MPKAQTDFKLGDNCTCLYNHIAYDAKIVDVRNIGTPKETYVVHFVGWNSRYDEAIALDAVASRIFPGPAVEYVNSNKGTVKLDEKQAKKNAEQEKQTGNDSDGEGRSAGPPVKKLKKTPFQNSNKKQQIKIELPKQLRIVLVDDLAMVNASFIHRLPANYNIDRIITDYIKTIPITNDQMNNMEDLYIEYEDNQTKVTNVALICTARGLGDYFNVVLGYQLLYKFERAQYNDLVQSEAASRGIRRGNIATLPDHGFRASANYGVVHLLRMIARLPDLLKLTDWNDHLINRIQSGIHDFLVFINKNIDHYFQNSDAYEQATPDYQRRALVAEDAPGPSQ